MINTRILQKIFKAVRAVVGVLFCANMILIAAGVTVAAVNLPNKRAAAEQEKREIINCIIDSYADWQQLVLYAQRNQAYLPYYTIESQDYTQMQGYQREPATNNTILLTGTKNNLANGMVTYGFSITNFNTDLPLLSRDIRISESEGQLSGVSTLDDFKKLGWYDKAVSVMRTQTHGFSIENGDTTSSDTLAFTYLTDGNNTKTYTFSKENENEFYYIEY